LVFFEDCSAGVTLGVTVERPPRPAHALAGSSQGDWRHPSGWATELEFRCRGEADDRWSRKKPSAALFHNSSL
jgi:hypothetical protein